MSQNSTTTILIAEDNEIARLYLATILGEVGYQVLSAANGQEALSFVEAGKPQLLLLDVEMPVMNGIECAMKLRAGEKQGTHLPVIALTGYVTESDRERFLKSGFDSCLAKPVDEEVLLREIALHLPEK